jgi:peptide deformylase
MELLTFPNPMLTTPCQPFDFNNPPVNPHQLSKDMVDFCYKNQGIGLSANQVGYPYSVFVILGEETYACFNPKIINIGKEEILLEESCLSYPGLTVKIKRPGEVRIRFQTPSGGITTRVFNGLSAKTVLHEIDHLNGDIFYKRANRYHLEQAMKKRNKNYG